MPSSYPTEYSEQQILNRIFDEANNAINVQIDTVSGSLTVTGDLTVNGDFNFGDASVDTLIATGDINLLDDVKLEFGTGLDYWFTYDSANTQFELNSTDIDGGGTDGVIFYVADGERNLTFKGGFTLDADAGVNRDVRFIDGDVAHGMTGIAFVPALTTGTSGVIGNIGGAYGGLNLVGLTDSDSFSALLLQGIMGTASPSNPAITFRGSKKNGTSNQALAPTENLCRIQNLTTDVYLLNADGKILATEAGGEAWSVEHDGSNMIISSSIGAHKMSVATITDGEATTGDGGVEITQTLNDTTTSDGSAGTYAAHRVNITDTDSTAYGNTYAYVIGALGAEAWTVSLTGLMSAADGSGSFTFGIDGSGNGEINSTAGEIFFQLAGTDKAIIDAGGLTVDNVSALTASTTLTIQDQSFSAADSAIEMATGTATNSSGEFVAVEIAPTINASSTAGYTALSIDVTETATGSGNNLLMSVGTDGNAVFSLNNEGKLTTNSGQTGLRVVDSMEVSTTDATPTASTAVITVSDGVYQVTARIAATETTDYDEAAGYVLHGTFKNDGGTLTQVGVTTSSHTEENTVAWDADFAVTGSNIEVEVTGAAGTNINWFIIVEAVSVS